MLLTKEQELRGQLRFHLLIYNFENGEDKIWWLRVWDTHFVFEDDEFIYGKEKTFYQGFLLKEVHLACDTKTHFSQSKRQPKAWIVGTASEIRIKGDVAYIEG